MSGSDTLRAEQDDFQDTLDEHGVLMGDDADLAVRNQDHWFNEVGQRIAELVAEVKDEQQKSWESFRKQQAKDIARIENAMVDGMKQLTEIRYGKLAEEHKEETRHLGERMEQNIGRLIESSLQDVQGSILDVLFRRDQEQLEEHKKETKILGMQIQQNIQQLVESSMRDVQDAALNIVFKREQKQLEQQARNINEIEQLFCNKQDEVYQKLSGHHGELLQTTERQFEQLLCHQQKTHDHLADSLEGKHHKMSQMVESVLGGFETSIGKLVPAVTDSLQHMSRTITDSVSGALSKSTETQQIHNKEATKALMRNIDRNCSDTNNSINRVMNAIDHTTEQIQNTLAETKRLLDIKTSDTLAHHRYEPLIPEQHVSRQKKDKTRKSCSRNESSSSEEEDNEEDDVHEDSMQSVRSVHNPSKANIPPFTGKESWIG